MLGIAARAAHVLRRIRRGGVWITLSLPVIGLIMLLIFILRNDQRADIGLPGARVVLPRPLLWN